MLRSVSAQPAACAHTLAVICSDCALDAARVCQLDASEVVTLRNPGNIVPSFGAGLGGEAAIIEHAVDVLGVRNIVVIGHSTCAAMAHLLRPPSSGGTSALEVFLRHAEGARRALGERERFLSGDVLLDATARENVLLQLDHLRSHPSVLLRRGADRVRLSGAFVRDRSGEVLVHDGRRGRAFVARRGLEAARPAAR